MIMRTKQDVLKGSILAGLQTIKGTKRGTIKAYRLTIKTPGSPLVNIQLSAREYTKHDAETLHAITEAIEAAYRLGDDIGRRTRERLDLYPDFKKRLADKGLIDSGAVLTIPELFGRFLADNPHLKPKTIDNKTQSKNKLLAFFGSTLSVDDITKKDALAYRERLDEDIKAGSIAAASAAGYVRDAKTVFNWAVKNELLEKNPFEYIKAGSFANTERGEYIDIERVKAIINAADSLELSAFLLVVRRLGLRVPSETNVLTWNAVDFERGIITIYSPKTERVKGKEKRTAPLFPDIKEILLELKRDQEERETFDGFVFQSYRGNNNKLAGRIERAQRRAGVGSWGRIFQNLRLSASVDIIDKFGVDAEALWIGHGETVRAKHYQGISNATNEAAQQWRI